MSELFDGVNDRVSFANAPVTYPSGSTLIAWIKPVLAVGRDTVLAAYDSGSDRYTGLTIRPGGSTGVVAFDAAWTGGASRWVSPDDTLAFGAWQGIAVTYDASSSANDPVLYRKPAGGAISSLAVTEVASPSGSFNSAVDGLWSGGVSGSYAFTGRIAYVRMFNSILTQAQIDAEMNAIAAVVTAFGDWPFISDANDISGNARNGTEAGGAAIDGDNPSIGTGGSLKTKSIAGGLTPAGGVTEMDLLLNSMAGVLTPTGTVIAQKLASAYQRSFGGTLGFSGAVNVVRLGGVVPKAVAGSITPTGTLFTVKNPSAGAGSSFLMRFLQVRGL